jgi:hypothetical protein
MGLIVAIQIILTVCEGGDKLRGFKICFRNEGNKSLWVSIKMNIWFI